MHVHTIHSGMCTVPILRRFCRESYTDAGALYEKLKRAGMDLVTVTDHDSIDAVERLRGYPDFFLSEEVTCRMPSGTEIHVGVYDISERQHVEIQRRRDDLEAFTAYLDEQDLFYTANHIFSGLTGRREFSDFEHFARYFPGFEVRNGHMLPAANRHSAEFAARLGKATIGGSDAHTLASAGTAWTEAPSARSKEHFLAAVRRGEALAGGEAGSCWKLTHDIFRIAGAMVAERRAAAVLAPLAPFIPVAIAANYLFEAGFARRWSGRVAEPSRKAPIGGIAGSGIAALEA